MRRIAVTVGALAAAVTLAFGTTGSAYAAEGVLVVGGVAYVDPSRCYDTDARPLTVDNHTDEVALVFSGPDCTGTLLELVAPGESTVSEFGTSVYVD
ncbi:hypothetical protein GCM10018785_50030 [Streptomyces longispororuber]|uniref:Secreted protein n=1 Tax=Streptomyces longispororuber TaxID=68230 RepID=A0A919DRQ6_9ACTN|nr:hypothetical protein [Streptomyces longispororuber]GHE75711.1 hypothetical protein GCM10018785_50030 [Streptomyces longispororuber]